MRVRIRRFGGLSQPHDHRRESELGKVSIRQSDGQGGRVGDAPRAVGTPGGLRRPIFNPCCFRYSESSSTVIPSTPGLPLFALTRCNACLQFSSSQTSSISRSLPARLSDLRFAISVSVPCSAALGASLLLSAGKASTSCSGRFFCRHPLMSRAAYLPFPLFPLRGTVRAFGSSFPARPILFAPPFGIGVPP
jgi:hypothetical protein